MNFNIGIFTLFIIYMVFWIQLPGLLVTKALLPSRLNWQTRMLSGFFLGFTVLSLLYLIESFTGIPFIIALAGPVLSIIAILLWLRAGRPRFFSENEHIRPAFIISFVLIYAISVLCFQSYYGGATTGVTTQVYHDFLYHTGNIVSLSRSFPNFDIRVDGVMFYYHYFFELNYAMCKHIFGMDAFSLYMNGNAYVCAWPLSLALGIIAERLAFGRLVTEKRYFFYTYGVFFSCMCLYPLNFVGAKLPFSWMDNHFYTNGNALGLATAINILFIEILVELWNEKFSIKILIALCMLTYAATGFKGTTGVMLVAITFAVFVIEAIIKREFSATKFKYVLGIIVSFAITYVLVVAGFATNGANNRTTTLSPQGTLDWSRVGEIMDRYLGLDYMSFPWIIIAIIGCIICFVGPCILPFGIYSFRRFRQLFKTWEIGEVYDWFVIGSAIIAVVALVSITIEGLSQGYLLISVAPLIFYGVVRYLENANSKFIKRLIFFFFACGILMQVADLASYVHTGNTQRAVYTSEAGDADNLVSKETMEAYFWLRDNTSEDSLIAVDRHTENLDWRQIYFYASAFAERQCFIEGFDYTDISEESSEAMLELNEDFYSEKSDVAETALEQENIDYLVVTKHSHPDYEATSSRLNLVFQNEEVSIYEFN